MKRCFFLLLMCCIAIANAAAQVLTQQDVIKLLELKIPEQTIIDKVKMSGTGFVLGASDIDRLKKAGASDALIAAMQATTSAPGTGSATSEITDLVLIVDYSGSMNAKMKDGAAKVASAKKCVGDLIDKLPNDLDVGLIVYGTHKQRGCQDIDIVQPLGPPDKSALKTKINSFNATGMTPIAASLLKAGDELKKAKGGSAIVLVTDGAETCHGDPVAVSAKLAAEFGVKFGINVIGFGIEPQEKAQLADIAAKGHGKLLTVENASELASALQKVAPEKVAPTPVPTPTPTPTPKPTPAPTPTPTPRGTRQYEAGGEAVKPGAFFNDAPLVQSGDYKGTLAMMQSCFYQVAVRKGQELRAIAIVQKTPYEGNNSIANQTFSITIYGPRLAQVAQEKMVIEGSPNEPATFRTTWTADSGGIAYVAISASDNQEENGNPVAVYRPKDPAPSAYTLKIKLDGEPASATPVSASQIEGGRGFVAAAALRVPGVAVSDLKLGEAAYYKLSVKKGDVLQVSAAMEKPWYDANNRNIEATYTLTIYDDDQVQVAQEKIKVSKNPPEPKSIAAQWPATMNGNAYVGVSARNSGDAIYPKDFQPSPGRLSVQVTTGENGGSSAAEESVKTERADEKSVTPTPSPAEKSKKEDGFSGAESTPEQR